MFGEQLISAPGHGECRRVLCVVTEPCEPLKCQRVFGLMRECGFVVCNCSFRITRVRVVRRTGDTRRHVIGVFGKPSLTVFSTLSFCCFSVLFIVFPFQVTMSDKTPLCNQTNLSNLD